jgi:DNA-binding transcriptional MocR family regulator
MAWKREEVRVRQQMARHILGDVVTGSAESQHAWVQLSPAWQSDDFVREARQRGVTVSPARDFAVARHDVPNAVRLALGAPPDRERLTQGLTTLAAILNEPPQPFGMTV